MSKNELKDIIGTEPENFFEAIMNDVTELVKYEALFNTESSREYYLGILNELYIFLIKQSKVALEHHYREEVGNIFSDKIKPLPSITNIIKTVMIVKTEKSKKNL